MESFPPLARLALRFDREGAVARLVLEAPPGNILDRAMTASLRTAVAGLAALPRLKLIVLEGRGAHFSYGVSIEEHRPEHAPAMLAGFHGLFRDLMDADVALLALVRGRCLGGGLELAAFCDWLFAVEGAELGQPEIRLGVFAPAASVLLPWRMGGRAADLLLTGRAVGAAEAHALGLADRVLAGTGAEADLERWIAEHVLPHSASSLRRARRAFRHALHERLRADLPRLERLYLDDLMATRDAAEGIDAFLTKRPPSWSDG
jgi:cyclohexa-1,5-dienecarbonyl-CoA hydratase